MKDFLQHYFESANAKIAAAYGMAGGLLKYTFLQVIQSEGYFESLGKAALTAMVCGVAGIGGKEVYGFAKKKVLKSKIRRRKNEFKNKT